LEVAENGRVVPLGRGRQRALLGLLLLRANEVVAQDVLVDALWGESPPPTALTALHGYVSRLRRLLDDGRLQTRPPGYALRIDPDELDLHRCRRLLQQQRYDEALALWRGPPLADLAFESFAQGEIARLEELRLTALEGRFEHELADGRHAELAAELSAAVREHPLRERFTAQLMLALYRAGRQADALAAYREARGRLVETLGLEPGPELQALQRRILEHDPALDLVPPARRRTRLPASPSSFVGRVRELEHLRELLHGPGPRLLTLTGAGGTGKTRLALEIARRMEGHFADGAHFVALAAVAEDAQVAPAVARALELHPGPGQSIPDALKAFVSERELLLLLDNFEHVLGAAPLVSELLAAAPGLTVLATSRTHLNLYGESEYAVPPLALRDPRSRPEDLAEVEAVSLFLERARAVRTDFALSASNAGAIAGICARLDGLPLAIELAAAQVRTLAPGQILARLERRLELLTGGPRDVHARQRTLRDTLRWSYDLLPETEQRLFARLGVFAGGWTVPAADHVCCGDLAIDAARGLASLAGQSLVRVDSASRFTMLETIRELALEQLPEREEVRARHARWFLGLAERGGPNLRGDARAAWLEEMGRERENVRAALSWSAGAEGDVEVGLRLTGALLPFWTAHALYGEGNRFLAALLARSREPTAGRARALVAAGWLAGLEGDIDTCEPACRESLTLLGPGDEWYRAVCLNLLGTMARFAGRLAEAHRRYDEALALAAERDLWWPTALAWANAGALATIEGRHRTAFECHERSVAIARAGGDRWMAAMCMLNLGRAASLAGDVRRAGALHGEALRAFERLDNAWGIAVCLDGFACLAAERGDFLGAARLFGAEEAVRRRAGVPPWRTIQREHDAGVHAASSALGDAAWSRARAQGGELALEQAIAQALASAAPER
jgi:predicted ATPase/DNA-binding SARP family transcriptional activator